jgi:hypothetical protein
MLDLPEDEADIVLLVRDFIDREVKPTVRELEHANTYPEPWGDVPVSTQCYAAVTEELARGWMSLADAQSRESFGQPIWQHQSIGNWPIWLPSWRRLAS